MSRLGRIKKRKLNDIGDSINSPDSVSGPFYCLCNVVIKFIRYVPVTYQGLKTELRTVFSAGIFRSSSSRGI